MKKTAFFLTLFLFHIMLCSGEEIIAVFDVGSGSIKMQVAKIEHDFIETLYTQIEKFSCEENDPIFHEGYITSNGIEKIKLILTTLKLKAEALNSVKFNGFATDLYRRSVNGKEVIFQISRDLSIDIKVITAEEEAFFGFLTVVQENNLDQDHLVVLDIGSGSFQIVCKDSNQFYVHTAPFGKGSISELIKNNNLTKLVTYLNDVHPAIFSKLCHPNVKVVGIGAHPKKILKNESSYKLLDVINAMEGGSDNCLDYNGLVLVKTIMESLRIETIEYRGAKAGNTTGFLRNERKQIL